MANDWRLLVDILRDPKMQDQKERICIDSYTPDGKEFVFQKELTGHYIDQVAKVEPLRWKPFIGKYTSELYAISEKPTEFSLIIRGKQGFDNFDYLIEKYCNLYSCRKLGIKSVRLILHMFTGEMPEYLRKTDRFYYLADAEKNMDGDGFFWAVHNGNYHKYPLFRHNTFREYGYVYSIRPVIELPKTLYAREVQKK